jgi:hypothetical protein
MSLENLSSLSTAASALAAFSSHAVRDHSMTGVRSCIGCRMVAIPRHSALCPRCVLSIIQLQPSSMDQEELARRSQRAHSYADSCAFPISAPVVHVRPLAFAEPVNRSSPVPQQRPPAARRKKLKSKQQYRWIQEKVSIG